MEHTLHPIHTTAHLRDTYIRYLKTIKPFQDDRLRREFAQALEEEDLLMKGLIWKSPHPLRRERAFGN